VDTLSHTKVQKLACPLIGFYSEYAQVWQGRRHTLKGRRGIVQVKSRGHASSKAILNTTISHLCVRHIQLYNDRLLGPFSSGAANGGHGAAPDGPLGAPLADLIGMCDIDEGEA
jgi:hypothetical protein